MQAWRDKLYALSKVAYLCGFWAAMDRTIYQRVEEQERDEILDELIAEVKALKQERDSCLDDLRALAQEVD